jgi:hypothetical protein
MQIFHDVATIPADFVPGFEDRLSPRVSLLIIAGLAALSWGMIGGIVMAFPAIL